MTEHGAVMFVEEMPGHVNGEIWADTEQIGVVGGVMDLAESETVRNHRVSHGLTIRDDMGRIEQTSMVETADGTALAIGHEYPGPEDGLMKSALGQLFDIGLLGVAECCQIEVSLTLVHRHGELVVSRVFLDQPHRILGDIDTLIHTHEVSQRKLFHHGLS